MPAPNSPSLQQAFATAQACHRQGQLGLAESHYQRVVKIDPDNDNMRYNFACVLSAYLLELDASLDLLEPVFERATANMILTAQTDPDLDPLRGNPRFETMCADAAARLGMQWRPVSSPAAS